MLLVRFVAIALALGAPSFAQTELAPAVDATPDLQTQVTPEVVSAEIIRERLAGLSETEQAAKALYEEALQRLDRAAKSAEAAAALRAEAENAPQRLQTIREELSRSPAVPTPDIPADATLVQLEQGEAEAIARLTAARQTESQLQNETTRRQERRTQIQDSLPQRRQDLTLVEEAMAASPPADADPALTIARRTSLLAEQRELRARIDELEAERASYDARRDLLPARRDRAVRAVAEAEQLVTAWRELVTARRQLEAERAARDAERLRREAARRDPALQAYAAETKRLAEQRTVATSIPMRISLASEEAARVRSEFAALRQRYAAVQQRLASSGLDRATGLLLRREFESLPDLVAIERRLRDTEEELAEIEFTLFERQDARAGSDDISRARETLLASVAGTEASAADVQAVATELVTARRDVLAELESDADRYQDVLLTLARDAEQLFQATSAYESFIRERILWVRSIPADRLALVEDTQTAITLIADRQTWRDGLQRIWTDIRNRFPTTIFAVATLVLTFATGRVCKRRLKANADQVSRFRTDHFGLTLRALGYTTVASLPGAATVWWLGWVLARPADQVDLLLSLGHGLQAAAFLLFVLRFTYHGCRVDGLGGAHFRWPAVGMRFVRAHLRWYVPVAVVAAVAVLALDRLGDESAKASVSRIVFTGAMLASAVLLQRLVRPHGPLASAWLGQRRDGWVDRLRVVWYPAIVAVPVALAVLSWLGFHYTALQLEGRIEATIAIVLLLLLINGLLVRWLFLARRRVAVEDARRRREQAMAAQIEGSAKDDDAPTEATLPPIDEDKLDLPNISMQTRQLFRTALAIGAVLSLYAVWADVLPALRMLEQVEVYPNQRLVEVDAANTIPLLETTPVTESQPASTDANVGSATTAASPSSSALPLPLPSAAPSDETTASSVISVTLADVGLAAVALLATFIAFRNLPGLIEIVVLQRLPLDAGSRYALSMVLKYLIAIIGVAAAFSAVNLAWSNIQWLAAALTFGLAFGLQEIFANFISGLIILAERPIRIGDTVTVGSVNGTVTRIRMRATTITDWDRKELIIPNKNFITGDVINWTLSDPLLRLIIPVGVSYSGDARKAEEILLGVASRAKNVLEDPKPFVVFNGFGDSTLNFELRVFIPHVNHIISVRHELHMLILEEFRKADIEIAFPQRDLHIRSIGDLKDVLIAKEQPELAGVRVDD